MWESVSNQCSAENEIAEDTESVHCNLCGADDAEELYRRSDYRFEIDEVEWPLVCCRQCGLAYVNPRPTADAIWRYYPPHFYNHREVTELKARYELQASYLSALPPGRLLDIGCAKGDWIKLMTSRGWVCSGLEPSPASGNPYNLPIQHASVETANYPVNYFNVITSWAAFEHMHDPMKAFQMVERWLIPGGRLIIVVTNIRSLASRWAYQEDIPRHLVVFSEASLRKYALATGLRFMQVVHDARFFGGGARGLHIRLFEMFGMSRLTFFRAMKLPLIERLSTYPLLTIVDLPFNLLERILLPNWLVCMLGFNGTIVATFEKPT